MKIIRFNVSMLHVACSLMQHRLFTCIMPFQKQEVTNCNMTAGTLAEKWLGWVCSKVSDVSNIIGFLLKHYQKVFTPPQRACVSIVIGIQNYTKELR